MNTSVTLNRPIALMLLLTLMLMMAIPAGLVNLLPKKEPINNAGHVVGDDLKVKLYVSETKQVIDLPLEEYVKGVVAAEMPADFALEALKAQAIAARTNAVRRIQKNMLTPEGAHVTDDHRQVQAYSSDDKLKQRWGVMEYGLNQNKIAQAVNETHGQIITYNGEPIDALFFSTSNGKTENSQDYFAKSLPYLRSVDSVWDKGSKHDTDTQQFTLQDFHSKLGIQAVVTSTNQGQMIKVLDRSASNRVKSLNVAGKVLTGPQFRELLGLYSTDFTWKVSGDTITFTTHGYGHGVGLSQYGAQGMAKEGKKAADIVTYYYQGATLAPYKKQ